MPWTRAADGSANCSRSTCSSPPCGPEPVTTVPVNCATATSTAIDHTPIRIERGNAAAPTAPGAAARSDGPTGARREVSVVSLPLPPSSRSQARQCSTTAAATSTCDAKKCDITMGGDRCVSTVTAPSTT